MSTIKKEALKRISEETKVCKFDENSTFTIRKVKTGISTKEGVSELEILSQCLVDPEFTKEELAELSVDIVSVFGKSIAEFNDLDLENIEKN